MMKNIRMTLVAILGCITSLDAMSTEQSDPMNTPKTVHWQAFKEARSKIRAYDDLDINKMEFEERELKNRIALFTEDIMLQASDDKPITLRFLLETCKNYINSTSSCLAFIESYIDFNAEATENDCTLATHYQPKVRYMNRIMGSIEGDFQTVYAECTARSTYEEGTYTEPSMVGQCKDFLKHTEKCTQYLIKHYTEQKQYNTSTKTQKNYDCIINLLKTGQIDLPVSKLEKKCRL